MLELLVNSKTITISSIEDLLNPILGGSTNSTPKSKFNKQMDLSTDLQEITGLSRMSRPGVVKLLWRYIKLMGFQKGKTILNDSRLEKIFGKKKMDMFAMNKVNFVEILGNHISTQAYELKKLIQKLLGKHLYEIEEGHDQESDAQVTENSDSDI